MGWDAPWHWVILAIIVIALFGYKKLPDAARSLGRSLRIFKTEIKGMSEDDKARAAAHEQQAEAPRALPAAEPVTPAAPPVSPASAPVQAPAPEPATTPSSSSTSAHAQDEHR